jgi:transcriptional regulator
MDDMVAKGRLVIPRLKGEDSPLAKLTEVDVLKIRALAEIGTTQQEIADQFGVKRQAISRIVLRQRWQHI